MSYWLSPCVVCGYNGPGFDQPVKHACAKHLTERDAFLAEFKRWKAVAHERSEFAVKMVDENATLRDEIAKVKASWGGDCDSCNAEAEYYQCEECFSNEAERYGRIEDERRALLQAAKALLADHEKFCTHGTFESADRVRKAIASAAEEEDSQ